MVYRKVKRIVEGRNAVDGAGVKLVRVLGLPTVKDFDPFLLLDAFDSSHPDDYIRGFPWHPHRGIETVTYLIQGDIEHGDSLGNRGSILDGGCQWMTAGSGIIHQEMPQASPRMLGLQLWLNLPARDKMTTPAYRDLTAGKIPLLGDAGSRVAIIAGSYRGTEGAMKADYVPVTMLDIFLDASASLEIPVPAGETAFCYIIDGALSFDSPASLSPVESKRALIFGDGDIIRFEASASAPARAVLFHAPPLGEPVAWGGPIVMNTQAELDTAFRDLDNETFIKKA